MRFSFCRLGPAMGPGDTSIANEGAMFDRVQSLDGP